MKGFDVEKVYTAYVVKETNKGNTPVSREIFLVICQSFCEALLNKK